MFDGANEAAKSIGSGRLLEKNTANAVTTSESSSRVMSTPSTLAPTSTDSTERPSTIAHAMSTHTHHDHSIPNWAAIWPATTPPKKP